MIYLTAHYLRQKSHYFRDWSLQCLVYSANKSKPFLDFYLENLFLIGRSEHLHAPILKMKNDPSASKCNLKDRIFLCSPKYSICIGCILFSDSNNLFFRLIWIRSSLYVANSVLPSEGRRIRSPGAQPRSSFKYIYLTLHRWDPHIL